MEETNNSCRFFVRNTLEEQPFGRPRKILDDNIIMVFKKWTAKTGTRVNLDYTDFRYNG
jgi:hypothetical protein